MNLGAFEIIAIAAIALLFFGPSKLPGLGKSIGEGIRSFKKGMDDVQNSMNERDDKNANSQANASRNVSDTEKNGDHT